MEEWRKRLKNKPFNYWIRDEIEAIIKEKSIDRSRFHEYSKLNYYAVIKAFYYALIYNRALEISPLSAAAGGAGGHGLPCKPGEADGGAVPPCPRPCPRAPGSAAVAPFTLPKALRYAGLSCCKKEQIARSRQGYGKVCTLYWL
ncbi:MAG: hypothetical protein ACLSB9_26275 [Hydrogeniiclostridium mannosilyticum]